MWFVGCVIPWVILVVGRHGRGHKADEKQKKRSCRCVAEMRDMRNAKYIPLYLSYRIFPPVERERVQAFGGLVGCGACWQPHPLCTAPPPRETQDEDLTLHTLRTLIRQNVWNNGPREDSPDIECLDVLTDEDLATPPPRPPWPAPTWALPDPGAEPTIYVPDNEDYDDTPWGSLPFIGNLPDGWGPVTPMNHNNSRFIVVTLTTRLPFVFWPAAGGRAGRWASPAALMAASWGNSSTAAGP